MSQLVGTGRVGERRTGPAAPKKEPKKKQAVGRKTHKKNKERGVIADSHRG